MMPCTISSTSIPSEKTFGLSNISEALFHSSFWKTSPSTVDVSGLKRLEKIGGKSGSVHGYPASIIPRTKSYSSTILFASAGEFSTAEFSTGEFSSAQLSIVPVDEPTCDLRSVYLNLLKLAPPRFKRGSFINCSYLDCTQPIPAFFILFICIPTT